MSEQELVNKALSYINELLASQTINEMPEEFKDNQEMQKAYNYIVAVRDALKCFSSGDFSKVVMLKGSVGGMLKMLQANLQHLNWQVQMVSNGDFTQRVDFMGEFSAAFNKMVVEFDQNLKDITLQKEQLKAMAEDLNKEIAIRKQTENILKESERRYREMSRLDPLTNLYNRRYFKELACIELHKMRRNKGACAVAMLDIDHFKRFNDTFGHKNGDVCLRSTANLLTAQLRKFDLIARYGGEEFVLILAQPTQKASLPILERIRAAIEKTPIIIDTGQETSITISIGYSMLTVDSDDVEALLSAAVGRADEALYRAKETRNCVEFKA